MLPDYLLLRSALRSLGMVRKFFGTVRNRVSPQWVHLPLSCLKPTCRFGQMMPFLEKRLLHALHMSNTIMCGDMKWTGVLRHNGGLRAPAGQLSAVGPLRGTHDVAPHALHTFPSGLGAIAAPGCAKDDSDASESSTAASRSRRLLRPESWLPVDGKRVRRRRALPHACRPRAQGRRNTAWEGGRCRHRRPAARRRLTRAAVAPLPRLRPRAGPKIER